MSSIQPRNDIVPQAHALDLDHVSDINLDGSPQVQHAELLPLLPCDESYYGSRSSFRMNDTRIGGKHSTTVKHSLPRSLEAGADLLHQLDFSDAGEHETYDIWFDIGIGCLPHDRVSYP